MSYETIPIESKDAGTVHILTGTVNAINLEDSTAEVYIDDIGDFSDIPIFYHCEMDNDFNTPSQTADGIPFCIGNRVIVVNYGDAENLSAEDMKVVGFEDGLVRKCFWEESFGVTFCANHKWSDRYSYSNSGNPGDATYICELGPDLSLENGVLSYSHTNTGPDDRDVDSHLLKWERNIDPQPCIQNKTAIKIVIPTVQLSGSPEYPFDEVSIAMTLSIIKSDQSSGFVYIFFDSNIREHIGSGTHEILLDSGNPVTVQSILLGSNTRKGVSAVWRLDNIEFLS